MARMEGEEYPQARTCLDTAYAKAKLRPSYRTYMLDTQMVRWLLGSCVAGQNADVDQCAISAAQLASGRIASMSDDLDDYVIRLAYPFCQFWDKFSRELGYQARESISRVLGELLDAIDDFRHHWQLSEDEKRIRILLSKRV